MALSPMAKGCVGLRAIARTVTDKPPDLIAS
jgi:hypothetical protein